MPSTVGSLVPAILRHLRGYAEVAGADARDAAAMLARRLATLLFAAAVGLIALLMFCVWLLALAWDGPWRPWVAAGLALLFAAAFVALAMPILRRRSGADSVYFSRVRHELHRDRELIERALNGGGNAPG